MNAEPRRTFSVRLKPYTAEMLERAVRTMRGEHWRDYDKRWLLHWAIVAVARAVVKDGQMPVPMAVELRHETPEETAERCGRTYLAGRGQLGPIGPDFEWGGAE
jgi:hypothetical protein